jgi:AcrR family transcriptional regulator/DNA-binding transcriptional ArsR family regulator
MATFTVDDRGEARGARAAALARRIAELDPVRPIDEARLDSLGLGLVDAALSADDAALDAALAALRELRGRALEGGEASDRLLGWLTAAISFSYWGLERVSPEASLSEVAEGTHAGDFMQALGRSETLGSGELRELLGVDDTEVSRSGRRLLESGLVRRSKVGRRVFWELTPRGRGALRRAPKPQTAAHRDRPAAPATTGAGADFWMEAIRQGFEGAGGDEPAMGRRSVDPTRERIIECTLELHQAQGVRETSFEDIAAKAGVPKETIAGYFPTADDLVMGCAQHALASLRLPPPERAGEVFAGASTEEERVHRLIATLFDVYERQADTLDRGRQDRAEVPLVAESFEQVETSVDALVAEALRPLDPDAETIASVRALTDLEVWRALREAGASAGASVDDATAALERWLESQRTRGRAPAA